jgi:hypothetical protein
MATFAPGAAADPINAKNGFVLPVTCDGQSVEFVVIGNGDFTPGHVVGSTPVFVLEACDVTFQFTPPGGPTETEVASRSKQTCTGIW